MKGDSAGIEINDVPKKGFAGKADPVHPVAPCKGDVRFGGDDDESAGSFANERGRPEDGTAGARGMKPMTDAQVQPSSSDTGQKREAEKRGFTTAVAPAHIAASIE